MAQALFSYDFVGCRVFADLKAKLIGYLLTEIKIIDEFTKRHAPELHDDEFDLKRVFNLPQRNENKELQRQNKDPHREDESLGYEYECDLNDCEYDTDFGRCLDLTDYLFELLFGKLGLDRNLELLVFKLQRKICLGIDEYIRLDDSDTKLVRLTYRLSQRLGVCKLNL